MESPMEGTTIVSFSGIRAAAELWNDRGAISNPLKPLLLIGENTATCCQGHSTGRSSAARSEMTVWPKSTGSMVRYC